MLPEIMCVRWKGAPLRARAAVAAMIGALGLALSACSGGTDDPTVVSPDGQLGEYTVSGRISVADSLAIDSDTNDPVQVGRTVNNSLGTAQALSTPVQLVGYLNVPGEGPDGPNQAAGDLIDAYRVTLQAGQTVEIDFSANPEETDVDLGIFDTAGALLGQSNGRNSYECVQVTASGDYVVAAVLYVDNPGASRGGTVYQMRIEAPGAGTSCPNRTQADAGIVAGEVIARLHDPARLDAKALASPLARPTVIKGVIGSDAPALLAVPTDWSAWRVRAGLTKGMDGTGGVHVRTWGGLSAGLPDSTMRVLDTLGFAKGLALSGLYQYAEPNVRVKAFQVQPFPPNDREYARQKWHYDSIELTGAINDLVAINPPPAYVPIVAVVDSGIVADHPDLARQQVPGFDFVSAPTTAGDGNGVDNNPNDEDRSTGASFHGSHVAGTVAAQTWDGTGGAGVAPMARIMAIRALGATGGTNFDVIQGIRFAAGLPNSANVLPARKADVINLSLGSNSSDCSPAEQAVFDEVRNAGVIVVAAAGNESDSRSLTPVSRPASCRGVISVGATDAQRRRAPYSNGGANLIVSAPGGDGSQNTTGAPDSIASASAQVRGGTRTPVMAYLDGTSMASPHVAGVMALMRFAAPGITPAQVDQLISSGQIVDDLGEAGRDVQFGYGRINARKAVAAARSLSGTAPAPQPGAIVANPSSISLGSIRSTVEFELRASGSTNERVVGVATNATTISVAPKPGAVDANGLGVYVVSANRADLQGASAFPKVIVTLAPTRTVEVSVSIEPGGGANGGGDLGPVYVLVVDATGTEPVPIAQAAVASAVNGVYEYSVKVPGTKSIAVVAGTDTDNDSVICNRGEGCGAYPLLGNQVRVLEPTGNLGGIDFNVAPFGGISASSAAGSAADASTPGMIHLPLDTAEPSRALRRLR